MLIPQTSLHCLSDCDAVGMVPRDVSMSMGLCADEPVLKAKQQQLAAKEFSAGVIAFYWAVSKRCNQLAHHNVFLSGGVYGSASAQGSCKRNTPATEATTRGCAIVCSACKSLVMN